MKNRAGSLLTATLVSVCLSAAASAAIVFNPVVAVVGDGNTIASGAGVTTTIEIFKNTVASQASPVASLAYSGLINTNSTVEGMLSNNSALVDAAIAGQPFSGTGYVFSAGYVGTDNTASVTTAADRVVGFMKVGLGALSSAGLSGTQPQASTYNASTFRGAVGDDTATNFWTAGTATTGSTAGFRYFNSNTQIPVTPTNITNTRTMSIQKGQLFGGTSSGSAVGVYAIGTGLPGQNGATITSQTATSFIATGTSANHAPEQFVLMTDPTNQASTATTFGFNTAYIADDGSAASEAPADKGIEKWVWNGASWNNVYTISDGVATGYRGLVAQFDTATGNAILWATTQDGKNLEQFTDLLAGTASNTAANASVITLATAPTNDLFRGVALSPSAVAGPAPEPASLALIAWGAAGLLTRRRRVS